MSKDDIVNTKLPSYEVHNATAERILKETARRIKQTMPPGFGFTLLIFSYEGTESDPGLLFYVSSAEREGMIKTMKEFIAKQEAQS